MKNKKLLTIGSFLTLALTLLSIGLANLPTEEKAKAAITPNEIPQVNINLPQSGEVSDLRSDSDLYGNQIYTWLRTSGSCSGIYYQLYNRSGLPLTAATAADEDCGNSYTFSTPDITFLKSSFAISYVKNPKIGGSTVVAKTFDTSNFAEHASIVVNDSSNINAFARPRITANLSSSTDLGSNFTVVFQGCRDSSCQDYNIYSQELTYDLSRVHANNHQLNSSESLTAEHANIAYSNYLYMVTWEETNSLGEPSIIAKFIDSTTQTIGNNITLSASNSQESYPDIAASPDLIEENVLTAENNEGNLDSNFYIAYSRFASASNSTDIFIQKITCNNEFNFNSNTSTHVSCSTAARNGEVNIARASTESSNDLQPNISAFKNFYDIKQVDPYEDTSIDYFTVGWIANQPQLGSSDFIIRNYSNSLTQIGSQINLTTNISQSSGVAISSDAEGAFTASYVESNTGHSVLFPSEYLKRGTERLVNAPSSYAKTHPTTSVGPNGNYVITYENFNGNDWDVFYSLYDKYGNPIKIASYVGQTIEYNETGPKVDFFNEENNSSDYGKFVIAWQQEITGGNTNIYYRVFNADGSANTDEIIAHSNTGTDRESVDLAAGKNQQFILVWKEINSSNIEIKSSYHNGVEVIDNNVATGVVNNDTLNNPHVAISPQADGTTGPSGKSKFVVSWNTGYGTGKIKEGYLNSNTTVSLGSEQGVVGAVSDLSGGYNSELVGTTVTNDAFFYAITAMNVDYTFSAKAKVFGSSEQFDVPNSGSEDLHASVDPATGNIMTIGVDTIPYTNYLNKEQVILTQADVPLSKSGPTLMSSNYGNTFDLLEGHGQYGYIQNSTSPLYGGNVGILTSHNTTDIRNATVLYFGTDISTHFIVGNIYQASTSGTNSRVIYVGTNFVVMEEVDHSYIEGETLNNPDNDTIVSFEEAYDFYLNSAEGLNFNNGSFIHKTSNPTEIASVLASTDTLVVGLPNVGIASFTVGDSISHFTSDAFINASPTNYIPTTISELNIFNINGETRPYWIQKGPTFPVNLNFYYGQSIGYPDIDYNTSANTDDSKYAVATYAVTDGSDYLDTEGIYMQQINDPFTRGSTEDLSPITDQQINSGGKYIIVPQTIDFGNIGRGSSASVNFADLTPACLQVTDLDGTDFDLTVSLTNLVNSSLSSEIIPNTNFIISNNDGVNPEVQANYSFSSGSDVTLDPSTNLGENANLGTTQTLIRKSNNNTGSWTICPKAELSVQSDAASGVYFGTITFTLI